METTKIDPVHTQESVELLSLAELKSLYETLLERQPPVRCGADFLKSNILWVLQAKAANQCPKKLRQSLLRLATNTKTSRLHSIKPGTCLVREWHGGTYEVTVLDVGYQFNGTTYKSLTQVAKVITGSHVSGPKFFGLARRANGT